MSTCPPLLAAVLAGADAKQLLGTRVYLFGSWLRDPTRARDIDVLVLYPDGALTSAHRLADDIRSTHNGPPYDVLVLSATEEAEVAFLANEPACHIWSFGATT